MFSFFGQAVVNRVLSDASLCRPLLLPVCRRSLLAVLVLGASLLLKRTLGMRCFCLFTSVVSERHHPFLAFSGPSPVSQISTDRSHPGTVYSGGRSSTSARRDTVLLYAFSLLYDSCPDSLPISMANVDAPNVKMP